MLRQEELDFIKVISNIEVSPIFLMELKNAVAAGKRQKVLAALRPAQTAHRASSAPAESVGRVPPASLSTQAREKPRNLRAQTAVWASQPPPSPGHLFDNGSEAQGTTGE